MDKYKNKYRIPSARLRGYDYASEGAYFITICTHNREHFFGEIADGKMHLNEIGKLAEKYWAEIPDHFPDVELGNFVIMPNHVHGILILNEWIDNICGDETIVLTQDVETTHALSLRPSEHPSGQQSLEIPSEPLKKIGQINITN